MTGPHILWFGLLVVSHHHLAGLVDIAAAEGDDQIALPGVLLDPIGSFLQTVHQNRAGNLCSQLCAGDAGVVGLTAAHDRSEHRDVGDLEHIHKVVEQHLGAAVCKRLVDGDQPLITHFLGRGQGGAQLGGVMGIIVHDQRTVAFAVDLKAAAGTLEVQGGIGALLHGQTDEAADGAHGKRIVNVVVAGHSQTDMTGDLAPLLQVELKEAGLVFVHVQCLIIAVVLDAKGAHAAVQRVHDVHGVLVIRIGKDHELGHEGKALEGELQLAHAAVVIQMVVVDVQHNGQIGGQLEEGLGELAGLDHDIVALAGLAVAIDEGQFAADDSGGVAACQFQRGGDHGSGGGLAVSAGDADALLVQAAHIAQQHAALDGGDAVGGSGTQLHVVLGDGRGIHHHVHTDDVVGAVAQADLHAHLPLVADDAAIQHIAAGDLVALGRKDLDQRIHAAAAAADEVDLFYIVQQMLVVVVVHEHSKETSNK